MGYVNMFCHICEGPADLDEMDLEDQEVFTDDTAVTRVRWMLDRVGIPDYKVLDLAVWGNFVVRPGRFPRSGVVAPCHRSTVPDFSAVTGG